MNIKDIVSDKKDSLVQLFNSSFYIPVYKKTEKIACAVFLITERTKDADNVHDVVEDTRKTALLSLKSVIAFLGSDHTRAGASACVSNLSSLRSLLHVLATVKLIRADFLQILVHEIDTVLAHLYTRFNESAATDVFESGEAEPAYIGSDRAPRRPPRPEARVSRSGGDTGTTVSSGGRRDAIREIIQTKGTVSIKDISDIIKDVSEKTIQRELMDMIRDGMIVKEGERRWSKYRLAA